VAIKHQHLHTSQLMTSAEASVNLTSLQNKHQHLYTSQLMTSD